MKKSISFQFFSLSLFQADIVINHFIVLPDQVHAGPVRGTEDPATGGVNLALSR